MLGDRQSKTDLDDVPEVEVASRRGISIVWLIPLIAGAIAIWLGYTTLQQKGPTVTISFANAEGLEAGKTKVKYKDVEVGLVNTVTISEDLSRIVVTADMVKGADHFLNKGTRFWIVRPRIGAGGITELGTLVSGAFVAVDPGAGEPTKSFTGLEEPPPINSDVAGRRFHLRATRLGSVSRGSPVYYHDIQVGQVLNYELADDHKTLDIDVFVAAPHDQLVRDSSRFWNASGFDVTLGTEGVDVSVESLQSLLAGGIAFDTPTVDRPGEPAAADTSFPLFDNYRAVTESRYTEKVFYLVYFDGSVRGLRSGAPVEFRGMRVGSVTDVSLEIDPKLETVRIPVTIAIEPERVTVLGGALGPEQNAMMSSLVAGGLRAQLKSGNLLTGELLVDLDFYPGSPPAKLGESATYPVIPSVPTQLEVLTASVTGILSKLSALPLPELVADLRTTVQGVNSLVASPDTKDTVTALREVGDPPAGVARHARRAARAAAQAGEFDARHDRHAGRPGLAAALRHGQSDARADQRRALDPGVRRLPPAPPGGLAPRQGGWPMTRPVRSLASATIVAGLLLAGCAATTPTRFYTLSGVVAPPGGEDLGAHDLAVGVGPVTLPEYLNRPQIVTRDGSNRVVLADFDSWAEPLDGLFARVLTDNLSLLLGTDDVVPLPLRREVRLDYDIEVNVTRFDVDSGGRAVLDARWVIYRDVSGQLVHGARSTIVEPAPADDQAAGVKALSLALGGLSRQIAAAITADQARTGGSRRKGRSSSAQ